MTLSYRLLWLLFLLFFNNFKLHAKPLSLQHAKQTITHSNQLTLAASDYLVSEKLDGVRGYWDGEYLYTRKGNKINVPYEFTQNWPKQILEGEIWWRRGFFSETAGIVNRKYSNMEDWLAIKFYLFDLPKHKGTFAERVAAMQQLVEKTNSPYLSVIEQQEFTTSDAMQAYFQKIVDGGAEGLMLHHKHAYYTKGKNPNIVKFKPIIDDEAIVLKHIEGKGKYKGMLGALLVENKRQQVFKIGTGFSDQERKTPPAIGSTITYAYSGYTKTGLPRFARFVRIRPLSTLATPTVETSTLATSP